MKTLTCKQMGGKEMESQMCDTPMTASTKEEMLKMGIEHLEHAHPEQAKMVKDAPQDSSMMKSWYEYFNGLWEKTPSI